MGKRHTCSCKVHLNGAAGASGSLSQRLTGVNRHLRAHVFHRAALCSAPAASLAPFWLLSTQIFPERLKLKSSQCLASSNRQRSPTTHVSSSVSAGVSAGMNRTWHAALSPEISRALEHSQCGCPPPCPSPEVSTFFCTFGAAARGLQSGWSRGWVGGCAQRGQAARVGSAFSSLHRSSRQEQPSCIVLGDNFGGVLGWLVALTQNNSSWGPSQAWSC